MIYIVPKSQKTIRAHRYEDEFALSHRDNFINWKNWTEKIKKKTGGTLLCFKFKSLTHCETLNAF